MGRKGIRRKDAASWSTLGESAGSIAADTTLLLAASSFIETIDDRVDPRNDLAFDAVTTAFCNGANLYLPLPNDAVEEIPTFLDLWRRHGVVTVPNLELTDAGFDRAVKLLAPRFGKFINGQPVETARWIQFQFTSPVVGNNLSRSDRFAILRAGNAAAALIENGSLKLFIRELVSLQKTENFREHEEYTSLIGSEIVSLPQLCVAYALSVCVRGYSYALRLGQLEGSPPYRHHWIRTPATTQSPIASLEGIERNSAAWFPWGIILRSIFDRKNSLVPVTQSKVTEVLEALRTDANKFRRQLAQSTQSSAAKGSAITDEEVFILDTLKNVGIVPRYKSSTRPAILVQWLLGLIKTSTPIVKVPIETLSSSLQPRWARDIESNTRLMYRRDTYWEVFADPSIRRAIQKFAKASV